MSKLERRHFSAQEKVKILRLHLLEGKAVSDLCEQHRITPSLFYQWQRQFFENGTRAFEPQDPGRSEGHEPIEQSRLHGGGVRCCRRHSQPRRKFAKVRARPCLGAGARAGAGADREGTPP